MIQFAVWHEGIEEGQGRWVLHVDAQHNRVLLVGADTTFYWRSLDDCKLVRAATPDQPTLVLPVAPPQQQITIPVMGNGRHA